MTKEQLEEALKKEIEEISKEFPLVKDGYAGYGENCMMELAQGVFRRLGFGEYEPYVKYWQKIADKSIKGELGDSIVVGNIDD